MFKHLLRSPGSGLPALLILLAAAPCLSQTTATIVGRVTDPAGATIAGASVAVENVDTGVSLKMASGAGGEYSVPDLPPGSLPGEHRGGWIQNQSYDWPVSFGQSDSAGGRRTRSGRCRNASRSRSNRSCRAIGHVIARQRCRW